MRLRVGVIYGGRSSEHEVSVASAASVISNLDPNRYEPVPIYINQEGRWTLPNKPPTTSSAAEIIQNSRSRAKSKDSTNHEVHLLIQPDDSSLLTIRRGPSETNDGAQDIINMIELDVIFPVVHGPYGEDGTIQGLFELSNVPYVGAGILASAIGMDKAVTKTLFRAHSLPIVDFAVVLASQWEASRDRTLDELTSCFDFPLFVKPANLGSSIGISKVKDLTQLEKGIELARQFDFKIIVESSIPKARELECAVLGNNAPEASSVGEILSAGEFYDYASKYVDDSSTLVIPASLKTEQNDAIRTMALEAFRVIGGAGMARVDFLMPQTEEHIYINEINTIPGFTNISMYPRLWKDSGLEYPQLLDRLIDLALNRHAAKQSLYTKLPSSQPTDHL